MKYRKHDFKPYGKEEMLCRKCGWVVGVPNNPTFVCTPEHLSTMACGAPVTHDCPEIFQGNRIYDEGSTIDYISYWSSSLHAT
jgi:hypothetical protein